MEESEKPIDPEVVPPAPPSAIAPRMADFAKNAVSMRLKNFGKYLHDGMLPSDAAAKAGFPSATSAISSLARVEFTENLRSALAKKGLDPDRLATEIDWGLTHSKEVNRFKDHSSYIGKLLEAMRDAHPEETSSKSNSQSAIPSDKVAKFKKYLNEKVDPGNAEIITRAISDFISDSD